MRTPTTMRFFGPGIGMSEETFQDWFTSLKRSVTTVGHLEFNVNGFNKPSCAFVNSYFLYKALTANLHVGKTEYTYNELLTLVDEYTKIPFIKWMVARELQLLLRLSLDTGKISEVTFTPVLDEYQDVILRRVPDYVEDLPSIISRKLR